MQQTLFPVQADPTQDRLVAAVTAAEERWRGVAVLSAATAGTALVLAIVAAVLAVVR